MAQLNCNVVEEMMEILIKNGVEGGVADILKLVVNEAMKVERSRHLNAAPYERTEARSDHANGFKPKRILTRVGELNLSIPQTRNSEFYPSMIEKGLRSERALIAAIGEMFIQGVSTRKVNAILFELCGGEISSTQVSRITQKLDAELSAWRERTLGVFDYLIVDARYEKVRYAGHVKDLAVLIAIGITAAGKREILGVSVSLSEAEIHWRTFFQSLVKRGLHGVSYVVSDDHCGIKSALKTVFPGISWNRCHTHLARNSQGYVSKTERKDPVAQDIRDILQAPDLVAAQHLLSRFTNKWKETEPKLVSWAETNLPDGFAVFSLDRKLHRHLRTSNLIERLNQELKRRSRVVRIFPNEDSCLRLMSALLAETHELWSSTERRLFSTHVI